MRKVAVAALCFFFLLSLISCASRAASVRAHSYVSSKTAWTYESTAVSGQGILKLSDGSQLVLPGDHYFLKQFQAGKTGSFLYCDKCSEGSGEVGTYLAPNDEKTRKVLDARGYVSGSGL